MADDEELDDVAVEGEDGAVEQVLLPHADEYEREGFYATSDLELRASETACKVPLRSLNDQAVWTLSTARPGNGIAELLETGIEKFWQSDGTLPHTLTLQFYRRQSIAEVALYVTHAMDDSYTPQKVSISSSSSGSRHDLVEVRSIVLADDIAPEAWIRVPLHDPNKKGLQRYLRTSYLHISFPFMYSNGRDLHLRGLHVLGPDEEPPVAPSSRSMPAWETPLMFSSSQVR